MPVSVDGYLSVADFRVRTAMPQSSVDALEAREPDFLQTQLNSASAWVNARLAKRYATPFSAPYPEIVLAWVTVLVTPIAYAKLGFQASSESDKALILDPAAEARAEIKEAADAKEGLFQLPLRQDAQASGVAKGGVLAYAEQSPYVAFDYQRRDAEDYR